MNKEEYNKILSDYQAKIECLNEAMNNFKRTNLPLTKESIKQQKQQRREWFLEHFDKIWENRHKKSTLKRTFSSLCGNLFTKLQCLFIFSLPRIGF